MVIEVEDGRDGQLKMIGNPVRFPGQGPVRWNRPPMLGEHSVKVLTELSALSRADIDLLLSRGIVRGAPDESAFNHSAPEDVTE
jgi:crotonobetainyl-CoA:carnitine CoA-transferase CaiB-like acyl-CoA transferase